jgi:hypothetical protein
MKDRLFPLVLLDVMLFHIEAGQAMPKHINMIPSHIFIHINGILLLDLHIEGGHLF